MVTNPMTARKIAPVVKKMAAKEQPSDFAYWQSRPPAKRLAALEEIRREYQLWRYHAEPGFQRVLTIVKRSRVENLENA